MAQADLSGARKSYEASLKLSMQRGDQSAAASARTSLARLTLEEGNAEESEKLARQSVDELQANKLVDSEADARDVLARALLAQDKLPEAQAEITAAAKISPQDRAVLISLALTGGQLKARAGNPREALRDLNTNLTAADRLKLIGSQFEIRLAMAEIKASLDSNAARDDVQKVERDAAGKGYLLIANKADSLRKSLTT